MCMLSPAKTSVPSIRLNNLCLKGLDAINTFNSTAVTIIAGDFNTLPDTEMCSLGLINNVTDPTHKGNFLDRIYTTHPIYSSVKVVISSVKKTSHKAVMACNSQICDFNKSRTKVTVRPHSPQQFADMLAYMGQVVFPYNTVYTSITDLKTDFDAFYDFLTSSLNIFSLLNK